MTLSKHAFSVPIETRPLPVPYDWNEILFAAMCDDEPMSNVKLITTKSAYKDAVHELALEAVIAKYPDWCYRSNKRAEKNLKKLERQFATSNITVREYVDCREDGTYIVAVGVEDINGEDAVERALELISMYRKYGKKEEFGLPVSFTYEQCWDVEQERD